MSRRTRARPLTHKCNSMDRLVGMAIQIWDDTKMVLVYRLRDSMPRRWKAVHRARGWYTKY